MAELIPFPGKTLNLWLTKGELAAVIGRSPRWLELRLRAGLPSEIRDERRVHHLGGALEWLETYERERQGRAGDGRPAVLLPPDPLHDEGGIADAATATDGEPPVPPPLAA